MQSARIERILEAQAETGKTIGQLIITLSGIGIISCLTLGIPDSFLLTSATTINIPFAGSASFRTTLVILPILLIGLRAYIEIYVSHWNRLEEISQRFRLSRRPIVSPLRHPVLRRCIGVVLHVLVPFVLLVLTYKAMVFPGWGAVMLALGIIVAIGQFLYPLLRRRVTIGISVLVLIFTAVSTQFGAFDQFRRPFQLQLANLERAELEGQDFDGAFLIRANLHETSSKFVKLRRANLWSADFSRSNLKGAILDNARLGVVNFGGSNAKCASFEGAILERANFQNTDLKGANLRDSMLFEATLENAKLSNADLTGANTEGADFYGATFCCTKMPNGELNNRDCQNTGMKPKTGCNPVRYCENLICTTRGDC